MDLPQNRPFKHVLCEASVSLYQYTCKMTSIHVQMFSSLKNNITYKSPTKKLLEITI